MGVGTVAGVGRLHALGHLRSSRPGLLVRLVDENTNGGWANDSHNNSSADGTKKHFGHDWGGDSAALSLSDGKIYPLGGLWNGRRSIVVVEPREKGREALGGDLEVGVQVDEESQLLGEPGRLTCSSPRRDTSSSMPRSVKYTVAPKRRRTRARPGGAARGRGRVPSRLLPTSWPGA